MPTDETIKPASVTLHFQDLLWSRNDATVSVLNGANLVYTYNARGAIWRLLRSLKDKNRKTVLLPAFHCPSMAFAVIEAGFKPLYYRIDKSLDIVHEDLLAKLSSDVSAVLIVNYFGFPAAIESIIEPCQKAGAMLIEDCAHSFLYSTPCRLTGERGDAAVFSFRKLLPCGPGGAIRINNKDIEIDNPTDRPPLSESLRKFKSWWEEALENNGANMLHHLYFSLERFRTSHKTQKHEVISDTPDSTNSGNCFNYRFDGLHGTTRTPWSTHRLINRADFSAVAKQRRENYLEIERTLSESSILHKIYPGLPEQVVPWAYPILIDGRATIDYRMREQGVPLFTHGETLHTSLLALSEKEPDMVNTARYISERILCLATHQNLKAKAIKSYCAAANKFTSSTKREQ